MSLMRYNGSLFSYHHFTLFCTSWLPSCCPLLNHHADFIAIVLCESMNYEFHFHCAFPCESMNCEFHFIHFIYYYDDVKQCIPHVGWPMRCTLVGTDSTCPASSPAVAAADDDALASSVKPTVCAASVTNVASSSACSLTLQSTQHNILYTPAMPIYQQQIILSQ